MKHKTRSTQQALRTIIRCEFGGSQAAFSRACGLNTAATSRLLAGVRPATIEIVSRAVAVLDERAARSLVESFLSDITSLLPKPYFVVVRTTAVTSDQTVEFDRAQQR